MNLLHLELPLLEPLRDDAPDVSNMTARPDSEEGVHRTVASGRAAIMQRLQEIDDEWSIDGIFEKGAAAVSAGTFVLGMMFDHRWFVVPLVIAVFLFQQALQGWCPVSAVLRRLGFRAAREIQFERRMLEQIEAEIAGCRCPDPLMTDIGSGARAAWPAPCPVCASSFSLREFLRGATPSARV